MKHTSETLKQEIANYFNDNPRCLVEAYCLEDDEDVENVEEQEEKLLKLEKVVSNPQSLEAAE